MAIPIVINPKKITNSKGFFTGFRNLTIDKAPIIPSERAMLPAIKVVITNVMAGNKEKVKLLKLEEGFAASCAGLPACYSQSTTNEALENIQSSITVHGSVVDELTQV